MLGPVAGATGIGGLGNGCTAEELLGAGPAVDVFTAEEDSVEFGAPGTGEAAVDGIGLGGVDTVRTSCALEVFPVCRCTDEGVVGVVSDGEDVVVARLGFDEAESPVIGGTCGADEGGV